MKRLFFWKRPTPTEGVSSPGAGGDEGAGILTGDPVQDSQAITFLLESIAEVSSHMALDVVLEGIVAKSLEVTKAERAVLLLGDSLDQLEVRLAQDNTGRDLGSDVVFSRTVVGRCLDDGAAHRSVVQSDREALELGQSVFQLKLRAVMCSLLQGKTGRLGVIYVDSTAVRREFSERDLELFGALSAQLGVALENARLHADSLEKVKLEKDVEIARRIQQHLLAPVPELPGLDVAVRFRAAEAASGDSYDVMRLPDGKVLIMIGDVTGHGVGAALLAHAAQAALRSYCELIDDIREVATRLNERLVAGVEAGNFMSVLLLAIDVDRGEMHYVNAGHPALILVRDGKVREFEKTGMVMGVVADQDYECRGPTALQEGDLLLLRTDGIDETMNPNREVFGADRLRSLLLECDGTSAGDVVSQLDRATTAHADGLGQQDDYTVVAIRVTGESR